MNFMEIRYQFGHIRNNVIEILCLLYNWISIFFLIITQRLMVCRTVLGQNIDVWLYNEHKLNHDESKMLFA